MTANENSIEQRVSLSTGNFEIVFNYFSYTDMNKKIRNFLFLLLSGFSLSSMQFSSLFASENNFTVLTYHDIVDNRDELIDDSVTVDHIVGHFEWLKLQGYHVVSLDDLKAAQDGVKPLPENAVLLSWDDAYASFYTHALPLLKAYNYPAVLAIVGSWMEPESGGLVQYGTSLVPRDKFMSWEQIKEAKDSGLVEIVSHSYDLHKGIVANRFGDLIPAAVARKFDFQTGEYETDEQYRERIHNDMQAGSKQIYQHLGVRPRAIVWPYGYYNMESVKIAAEFGMDITMSLNPVPSKVGQLQELSRVYLTQNPDIMLFRSYLKKRQQFEPKHFFRVSSKKLLENEQDYSRATCLPCRNFQEKDFSKPSFEVKYTAERESEYDKNIKFEKEFSYKETIFSSFKERLNDLNPSMVIVDPVISNEEGIETLFMNSRFPVVQDRLNRICWHTQKTVGVPVFLWISPELFVHRKGETFATVNNFFSDMGKFSPVRGLVVDNPLLPSVLLAESGNILKHQSIELEDWNPAQRRADRQRVIEHGTKQQAELLQPLESFQHWQPFLEVSCVISAEHFRKMSLKNFSTLLNLFDFLIVNIGNERVESFIERTEQKIAILRTSGMLREISFLLSTEEKSDDISEQLQQLPEAGVASWGYQFDNFHDNFPRESDVHYFISNKSFPYPLTR